MGSREGRRELLEGEKSKGKDGAEIGGHPLEGDIRSLLIKRPPLFKDHLVYMSLL